MRDSRCLQECRNSSDPHELEKRILYNWDVTVVDVEWCVVLMVVVLVSRLARFT